MNFPAHFHKFFLAECSKTLQRGSGVAAICVAGLVAALTLLVLWLPGHLGGDAVINGQSAADLFQPSGVMALSWSLKARNFFLLPLLLLWAVGASFTGEIRDHTLRAQLVRPVPRWSVLLAKLCALSVLSALTLAATAALSGAVGAALFGAEGEWGVVLLGYAASWLSDIGLLAMGILVALLVRSVAGVVVGVILFLVVDLGARLVLQGAEAFLGYTAAGTIRKFMPGEALAAWEGYGDAWNWVSFAGLGVLIALALGLALLRFRRLDVA